VETSANRLEPVHNPVFSTAWTHRANGGSKRFGSVFPLVHTPYDFYERI
jgi:hypothetical protein